MSKHAAFFSAPCRVDGARVYDASSNLVATVAYRRDTEEEAKACALIAAAPELLRDLIDACEWLDSILLGDRPKAALAGYRRTINKAEGNA